ncbi:MAG: AAA family ATPase [Actinomycetota bacterium]
MDDIQLTPVQERTYQRLRETLDVGRIASLTGGAGSGKTTLLRRLHDELGGGFVEIGQFTNALQSVDPFALEETFERVLRDALEEHETVFVDDVHLVHSIVSDCRYMYPRGGLISAVFASLAEFAVPFGRRLILGSEDGQIGAFSSFAYSAHLPEFQPDDYEAICRRYLPAELAGRLEFAKIHRFARRLNAHQLRNACRWLARDEALDTERFIEYLRAQGMASNVDLEEVQQVTLADLQGVEDIIESLEAHIVLPLENDELAAELGLSPKRGVLLAGPPGTGKTTAGRALAHRLRGKFFKIDGTFISGTDGFYGQIQRVFSAAKHNAPAVIFIDDSDVIFESGEEHGLYRYLLTMLDGLESESVGQVCVMMTAMDVANIPPALLRSGRVELWLEMRTPDAAARTRILEGHLEGLPARVGPVDVPRVAEATDGFTGADLKRLVQDGKNLLAYDQVRGLPLQPVTDYLLKAIDDVRESRVRYTEAEARSREHRRSAPRPPWFDVPDASDEELHSAN